MSSGALSFDKKEVKFQLDEENKPLGVYFKIGKDANKLIEEFVHAACKPKRGSVYWPRQERRSFYEHFCVPCT